METSLQGENGLQTFTGKLIFVKRGLINNIQHGLNEANVNGQVANNTCYLNSIKGVTLGKLNIYAILSEYPRAIWIFIPLVA